MVLFVEWILHSPRKTGAVETPREKYGKNLSIIKIPDGMCQAKNS